MNQSQTRSKKLPVPPAAIPGQWQSAHDRLRAVLENIIETTDEVGLQVAVVHDGKLVLSANAGLGDIERQVSVGPDTLFPVFSVTKAALIGAVLEAFTTGRLSPDLAIADIWPEFAHEGKAHVTVEQALKHQAAIPQVPEGVSIEDFCDWNTMTEAVSRLKPLWNPGSASGYHSYTYGWILGEVLRRGFDSTESVGQMITRLVLEPAGADDFWIGLPDQQHHRVATVYKQSDPSPRTNGLASRAIPPHLGTNQDVYGRPDVRRAALPAAGGIATAESVARLFGMLAARSQDTASGNWVRRAAVAQVDEPDLVTGVRQTRGLGFYTGGHTNSTQASPFGPDDCAFGHPGSGGSVGWADPSTGTGYAILKNRLSPEGWACKSTQRVLSVTREITNQLLATPSIGSIK